MFSRSFPAFLLVSTLLLGAGCTPNFRAAVPTNTVTPKTTGISETQTETPALAATSWTWLETALRNGERVTPKRTEAFTITFDADGTVHGTTDCNSFGGSYTVSNGTLTFGPFMQTKMYCEGSQEHVFLTALADVAAYRIEANGTLALSLRNEAGVMHFSPLR